jgi:hypothetical protein
MPRVLFSAPECRAIVIDLQTGEAMGNHHVRERAVVQVETLKASANLPREGTRSLQRRCRQVVSGRAFLGLGERYSLC